MKNKKRTHKRKTLRVIKLSRTHSSYKKSSLKNPKKIIKKKIQQSRPVHKRILFHPTTIFIILCTSIFVIGWTYKVIAASYEVTAQIPAPTLEQGAIITSPTNGATLTQTPIIVSGICPANSYVKLYSNNLFSGVAWCSPNSTFQIQTDLFEGDNALVAQDYNVIDQPGPTTPSISVRLVLPPATNSNLNTNSSSSLPGLENSSGATTPPPIILTTDFHYQTFTTGSVFSWQIDLEGGVPPYAVHIDWGDGTTSNLTFRTDPIFNITHTYTTQGYFSIKVFSTDTTGKGHMMQLAALIKVPGATGIFSAGNKGNGVSAIKSTQQNSFSNFLINSKAWLWLAWPSLVIVFLMITSFWLGERKEITHLLSKKRLSHR